MTIDHLPGRTFRYNGEEWLYFSGTAYLGIPHSAPFRSWLQEGMARYGSNFGGSRLSWPRLAVFAEAEARLATLARKEAALVVSSGSMAGQLVVKVLSEGRTAFFAPLSHPAIHGVAPVYPGSFGEWTVFVQNQLHRERRPAVLFTNSFDPLQVRGFEFDWLNDLPADIPVTLVLDDSHGLGITGAGGGGIASWLAVPDQVEMVVVSSLGKAFGVPGGVIVGPRRLIDEIWRHPFFGGASPAAPAHLYAFLQARELYREQLQLLRRNFQRLAPTLDELDLFRRLSDFPVFCTGRHELADYLAAHRILVSSFAYPTPEDDRLTRIVINSMHQEEDLEKLEKVLRQFVVEQDI